MFLKSTETKDITKIVVVGT